MRLLVLLPVLLAACLPSRPSTLVVVTTSLQDTGLADALTPVIERLSGARLVVIGVGSGEALAMGRRGDADVIVAHSPEAEDVFVREGHALRRLPLMKNDFVLVGPMEDPAGVAGSPDVGAALAKVAARHAPFVSRADRSGTHSRELSLWRRAGRSPARDVYVEAGVGQAEMLRLAAERRAYALTDRATLIAQELGSALAVLFEGGDDLLNPYHVLEVRPQPGREARSAIAARVADAFVSPETKAVIATFGIDLFGRPLFLPAE